MPTLVADPRELLTAEQKELYDGALTECWRNGEAAVAVLDRYDRLIEEQVRDVAAVREALCGTSTAQDSAHVVGTAR